MAKRKFENHETINEVLFLLNGTIKETKNGEPFWQGQFKADKETTVSGKIWNSSGGEKNRVEKLKNILTPNKPLMIKGKIEYYQDKPSITIESVSEAKDFDLTKFINESPQDKEKMIGEFEKFVDSIKDEDYKKLLKSFRNSEVFEKYTNSPAAKSIHHAYLFGLLEHSLTLAKNVDALSPVYPELNRDLLIAGAFLHDVGKCYEISPELGFEYTVEGKLWGHIYIGAKIVDDLIENIKGFPLEKRRQIIHLILSHQGFKKDMFGSPVDPSTPEAVFFHYLDNLDAKTRHVLSAIQNSDPEEVFVKTGKPTEMSIYRGEWFKESEEQSPKSERKNLFEED